MRRHVPHSKIASEERVYKDARSDGQQDPDGVNGPFGAYHQVRFLAQLADHGTNYCIDGKAKREQYRESAYVFHSSLDSSRMRGRHFACNLTAC